MSCMLLYALLSNAVLRIILGGMLGVLCRLASRGAHLTHQCIGLHLYTYYVMIPCEYAISIDIYCIYI